MFKQQIESLKLMAEGFTSEIADMEEVIKEKRALLRDTNQALASLERVQSKYEPTEVTEEIVVDEDGSVSV